jgi:ABC-type multidrug transport system ATPase subunit
MNDYYPIEIGFLSKHFGQVKAIDDISFNVREGEIFGLLGPNGAGKTTTIKLLVNLLKPTKGYIKILNQDVGQNFHKIAPYIGYIPDEPVFYDKLTAREFLNFLADLYNVDNKRCEYLLELFELKDYKDYLIEEYSFGMKRRLAIISSILHSPKVLIIDEPIAGLDVPAVELLKDIIKNMKHKATILLSTHILHFAESLCDRAGILYKGKLLELAKVDEIKEKFNTSSLEEAFLEIIGIKKKR